MILSTFLAKRRYAHHRLLQPGETEWWEARTQLSITDPDRHPDEMLDDLDRLMERRVYPGRFGRLTVTDGYGNQLGAWWPNRAERRRLHERHQIVDGHDIVEINGFGTVASFVSELPNEP